MLAIKKYIYQVYPRVAHLLHRLCPLELHLHISSDSQLTSYIEGYTTHQSVYTCVMWHKDEIEFVYQVEYYMVFNLNI